MCSGQGLTHGVSAIRNRQNAILNVAFRGKVWMPAVCVGRGASATEAVIKGLLLNLPLPASALPSPGAMKTDGNNVRKGNDAGDPSQVSSPRPDPDRLLPPRGDYQTLISFKKAEAVYDITFRFAHKFLARDDRTVDRQLLRLEQDFLKEGGLRERMTRLRLKARGACGG
jgi:four helix bundle suffix protein